MRHIRLKHCGLQTCSRGCLEYFSGLVFWNLARGSTDSRYRWPSPLDNRFNFKNCAQGFFALTSAFPHFEDIYYVIMSKINYCRILWMRYHFKWKVSKSGLNLESCAEHTILKPANVQTPDMLIPFPGFMLCPPPFPVTISCQLAYLFSILNNHDVFINLVALSFSGCCLPRFYIKRNNESISAGIKYL